MKTNAKLISVLLSALILVTICLSLRSTAPLYAEEEEEDFWTFAIYSDNRGSNDIHRMILQSLKKENPDVIINGGDIFHAHYKKKGSVDAFKKDIEATWGKDGVEEFWKRFYPVVGGFDEQYFKGKDGDNKAGQKLLDLFDIKVGDKEVVAMSQWGDYHFTHKGVNFIVLYRTDNWPFKTGQADWFEDRLKTIRVQSPDAPIVVYAHDGNWFNPSMIDSDQYDMEREEFVFHKGIKNDKERLNDQMVRLRLHQLMLDPKYHVDIAFAADMSDYWLNTAKTLVKMRTGSAGYGDSLYLIVRVYKDRFDLFAMTPNGENAFCKIDPDKEKEYSEWLKKDIFLDDFPNSIIKPFGKEPIIPKG